MREEFVINQSLDEKTIIKASARIFLRGRIIVYMFILFVFILVNIYTSLIYDNENINILTFAQILIPLIVTAGIWYSTKMTIHKNYIKNPRYFNNVILTLSVKSFKTEGKDYFNNTPWVNYVRIKETEKWFLIFMNKHQAHIIDKAQIKNFSIDELRTFFKQLPIKVSLK